MQKNSRQLKCFHRLTDDRFLELVEAIKIDDNIAYLGAKCPTCRKHFARVYAQVDQVDVNGEEDKGSGPDPSNTKPPKGGLW